MWSAWYHAASSPTLPVLVLPWRSQVCYIRRDYKWVRVWYHVVLSPIFPVLVSPWHSQVFKIQDNLLSDFKRYRNSSSTGE